MGQYNLVLRLRLGHRAIFFLEIRRFWSCDLIRGCLRLVNLVDLFLEIYLVGFDKNLLTSDEVTFLIHRSERGLLVSEHNMPVWQHAGVAPVYDYEGFF